MTETEIIELYLQRDEAAIARTDEKYGHLCFRIANHILHVQEDSEECVSDTYLTLWNRIPPVIPASLRAFICKITRNLALKRYQYLSAEKRNPHAAASLDELDRDLFVSAEAVYNTEFLAELISLFLKEQPEASKNTFILRYFYFLSIEEIALKTGFTKSNVKILLRRTRNKLKEYLKKEGISFRE